MSTTNYRDHITKKEKEAEKFEKKKW